jgi:hypothetical protein
MTKRFYIALLGFIASCAMPALAATELSLAPFVNPFVGTDPNPFSRVNYYFDTGNVFPGAVCRTARLKISASRISAGAACRA